MEKKVNMLTYNFENIGSDTLYQYLYKCIKNDIIQGKIKSGEKLPSKRALAKNLAISVITVENAYGQLAAEGYIYSVPKSGFYVADLRDDRMKSESGLSENRIYSNKLNLTGGKNAYIADFTSNQTEQSAFPFSIWTKTMRAVMNDYQTELMLNPPCGGVMELRQSIADYLKAFRNMTVRPEQIIIGAGTEYLSSLLIQLLGKELKYSVENPGYHKIAKIYRSMGACYEYIEIEEDGPKVGVTRYLTKPTNARELIGSLEEIEKNIQKPRSEEKQEMKVTNLFVQKAMDYISMNYSQKLTLTKISEQLCITPNYLSELFKKHTGQNVSEYIIDYRLEKACQFLKNPQLRIGEVSEKVGINDVRYFSSMFKKKYNLTPTEYRNKQ